MPTSTDEASLVAGAQAGDHQALDELVMAYLPLVYTVVRRALGGHPDVDDVVQDTMLRALRELRGLRAPERFRPWLVSIAVRQVGTYLYRHAVASDRFAPLDDLVEAPDPDADFEGSTLLDVELSHQRRQITRGSRWLDPHDRELLSLWWLETAGWLTRADLAAALGTSAAHAAVRVKRMRNQLELSRSVVAALEARPRCVRLGAVVADWDGVPSALWRKRIARHTQSCAACSQVADRLVAPERLLVGFALLPVPAALAATLIGKSGLAGTAVAGALSGTTAASGAAVGAGVKAGILGQIAQAIGAHPVAAAVTAGTLVAGAAVTTATWYAPTAPAPIAATSRPAVIEAPRSTSPRADPAPSRLIPTVASPSGTVNQQVTSGRVSLESANAVGFVITTNNGLGLLQRVNANSEPPDRQQATFEVVPGLSDPTCVSFRSADGRYLRHASWRLQLMPDEGTSLYRADATFCVRSGSIPGSVSLEAADYAGYFLRHRGDELWVDQSDGSAAFLADASFVPRPPLAR